MAVELGDSKLSPAPPPAPFLHPEEGKVSSSSSPYSLRSTPFSFCYNLREPAAEIASETCQSTAEPAPEVVPFFLINQLFAAFSVAA